LLPEALPNEFCAEETVAAYEPLAAADEAIAVLLTSILGLLMMKLLMLLFVIMFVTIFCSFLPPAVA